jgi:HK97 gp10 family phage protein
MAEEIIGLNAFKSRLDQLPLTVRRTILVSAVKKGGMLIQKLAQFKAPVRTGRGRKGIIMRMDESSPTSVKVDIGPSRQVFYMRFLEEGAKPHDIYRKSGAVIHHPGLSPRSYLISAWDEGIAEAHEIINDDIAFHLSEAIDTR